MIPDAQRKPPDESAAVFSHSATGELRAALVACAFSAMRMCRVFSLMKPPASASRAIRRETLFDKTDRYAALVELRAHPAVDLFLRVIEVSGKNALFYSKNAALP
ncbi:hypothetical protein [Caballeronia sp. INSB1]|uniref:hypothetical protein n=1 Tax=Caballeronia sp. INSB1 TaxID=2921751 RepID=UPI002032904D|nr:hypothetical protein [Caballeronia sp. INSB1]